MDVTPGPQLRRQITKLDQLLINFDSERREYDADENLPHPDWSSWAFAFAAGIEGILPLVRS